MKTSNFDFLFEIKEEFIDRALAIAFYTSAMPTIVNGKVAISQKLPPEMSYLGDLDFEIRLKEPPTVDAIEGNAIRLLLNIEFALSMLKGLRSEFDLVVSLAVVPTLQPQQNRLIADLSQGQIDEITFNNRDRLPRKAIKALNEVIKAALRTHLLDKLEEIDLTPFLKPLELPDPVEGIDAAVLWNNGKAYFFKGGMYVRYDVASDRADIDGIQPISPNWGDIWADGVDATMVYPNGKAYFFRDGYYMRFDIASNQVDQQARRIEDGWEGVWADGIDAAVAWNNGKAYFFKGHEYIRYDIAADKADDGYPLDISGNWPGAWTDGIDAVVLWNNGKAYFFKGDEYIRYDVAADRADPGYPLKVAGHWPGVWQGKLLLPARPGGFKTIGQRVLAAGINLFDNPLGNMVPVTDYTGTNDLWMGIPQRAMQQVFDFGWTNTAQHMKRKHWNETYRLTGNNDVLTYVNLFSDVLTSVIPNLLTGGVLSTDVSIDYLMFQVSATVSAEKPIFDLLPGNVVQVNNLRANICLYLKASTKITVSTTVDTSGWIPDEITPWEDDIVSSSSTTITLLDQSFHFSEAVQQVSARVIPDPQQGFDPQAGISIEITSLTFDLDLGVDLISDAATWLANSLAALILRVIPPIRLLPPLIEKKLQVSGANIHIQKDIVTIDVRDYVVPPQMTIQVLPWPFSIDNDELTAAGSVKVAEMGRSVAPLPLFVANTNPKRLEVHRLSCQWVDKIDQAYRLAYYVLIDAIHDGFDGCKYCLPEYHTR
ncbi:MAG: hemopexin repeat-containing protein [Dehalococcoidia bacterium]|nr:hemopexin repeat-containing protein [Dehalococcoidia bacterium]